MAEDFKPSVDLNLLAVLDTLLQTRNVTRAAEHLHLSQPTVSGYLRKLRLYFGDELLIRNGNRYELTPLAQQLATRTPAALETALSIFDANATFVPAQTRREFTLTMSDYETAIFLPVLSALLREQAPHARLRVVPATPEAIDQHPVTLRSVDGAIVPHGFMPGFPSINLFDDSWVCLTDHHNDRLSDPATPEQLQQLPWVALMEGVTHCAPPTRQLRIMGVDPHIEVATNSFLAAPAYVRETDRVVILPARLESYVSFTGLRVARCPDGVRHLGTAFIWHPLHDNDPGHHWMRSLLVEAAALLPEPNERYR